LPLQFFLKNSCLIIIVKLSTLPTHQAATKWL
jgi:hypothetical protein